jgi:alpha-tubulin suppressor-like RCC1 family protein
MPHLLSFFSAMVFIFLTANVAQATTAIAIATQFNHTCVVTDTGGVMCWGVNTYGELGDGTTVDKLVPVDVKGVGGVGLLTGIKAITAGWHHTCALSGSGNVLCWGSNLTGALGDNTLIDKTTPVVVRGVGGLGFLGNISSIAAGGFQTCAVSSVGTVFCWGWNADGQLGDNTYVDKLTPVPVVDVGGVGLLSGVSAIAMGHYHSCALGVDGGVKCWGWNGLYGILGNNNTAIQKSSVPVEVSGMGGVGLLGEITDISAADTFTCALSSSGGAFCWGFGPLGNSNSPSTIATPVRVLGAGGVDFLSGATEIASQNTRSCIVTTAAGVQCWGWNDSGGLGDNTTIDKYFPVDVVGVGGVGLLGGIKNVAVGNPMTCAITQAGGVYCWGGSHTGDNTSTLRNVPVWVTGFDDPDSDGVFGSNDAFPNNTAATTDANQNGLPDFWLEPNPFNCSPAAITCNGLTLDSNPPPMILNSSYKGSSIRESLSRQ